jgi:hypothetical protein
MFGAFGVRDKIKRLMDFRFCIAIYAPNPIHQTIGMRTIFHKGNLGSVMRTNKGIASSLTAL